MKKSIAQITAFSVLIVPAWAETTGTKSTSISLPYPALTGPLVANPNPFNFEAGPIGTIYITGALSGLGLVQSNPVSGNPSSLLDLDNGMLFIQKTTDCCSFMFRVAATLCHPLARPIFT
jgi:hypothetical protein